jgi:putative copper export protein
MAIAPKTAINLPCINMQLSPEWFQSVFLFLLNMSLVGMAGVLVLNTDLNAKQSWRINALCCAVFAVAWLAYALATTMVMTDSDESALLSRLYLVLNESHSGRMLQLIGLGCFLVITTLMMPKWQLPLRSIGVLIITWGLAAIGHIGSEGLLTSSVFFQTLHILAASIWLGMLIVYLMLKMNNPIKNAELVKHLSEIASITLLALLTTGLMNVIRVYEMSQHFWHSDYALILLAKLLVMLIAVGLAGLNRWYYLPKITDSPKASKNFYRVAVVETLLLVSVFLLASTLSNTMPSV